MIDQEGTRTYAVRASAEGPAGVVTRPAKSTRRLSEAERALAIHMWSMQGKTQAEIAEHFGVTQAAVSRLLRRDGGAAPRQRAARVHPDEAADSLREMQVRMTTHIQDCDTLLRQMRATMAILTRKPEAVGPPAGRVAYHETWAERLRRYTLSPTAEDGPTYWVKEHVMFEKPDGSVPFWDVEEWATEHPGTFLYVHEHGEHDEHPAEVITVEDAVEDYRAYQAEQRREAEAKQQVTHDPLAALPHLDNYDTVTPTPTSTPVEDDLMVLFALVLEKGEG